MIAKNSIFTSVLVVGCVIILVSFAIRSSFGVFQIPIAEEFNWLRSEFSLAIALQNLAWGIGQPIFSAIAEKIGDRRAIIIGGFTYASGLLLSSAAMTPQAHQIYEILVGFGVAGTGFGVILAVVGRASSEKNRSMSLAIATASGSAGQVIGAPIGELMLNYMPWQSVFVIFSITILSTLLLLPFMRVSVAINHKNATQNMRDLVGKAVVDPSYSMIFLGFFSCGYQLGFLTAHFPAFVTEMCNPILPASGIYNLGITSTSALGAISISLIGLANIAGTLGAGYLGKTYSKKYLLSSIYLGRTLVCAVFILTPMTPISVILFSLLMGALWLATVPLTSGLIAQIYGLRYMGTLYGIVFFSHQLGGFMGIWLGGRLYDAYGNYNLVWWIGIAVGAFSALVHLPIKERQKSWV